MFDWGLNPLLTYHTTWVSSIYSDFPAFEEYGCISHAFTEVTCFWHFSKNCIHWFKKVLLHFSFRLSHNIYQQVLINEDLLILCWPQEFLNMRTGKLVHICIRQAEGNSQWPRFRIINEITSYSNFLTNFFASSVSSLFFLLFGSVIGGVT